MLSKISFMEWMERRAGRVFACCAKRRGPSWDRPAFELGRIYFKRHDCDSALVWYSRVPPPNRPDGPEAVRNRCLPSGAQRHRPRGRPRFSRDCWNARIKADRKMRFSLREMHNNARDRASAAWQVERGQDGVRPRLGVGSGERITGSTTPSRKLLESRQLPQWLPWNVRGNRS